MILQHEQNQGVLCWKQHWPVRPTSPVAGCCVCLLLLPLSHYDVPQQGLLGELILIQQQIQRHEEEVRRAAAADSARPPTARARPQSASEPQPPSTEAQGEGPTPLRSVLFHKRFLKDHSYRVG